MKLNYGDDFIFHEDNASVHKSKKVKEFFKDSRINVLEWPAKSPDLNIIEDIWKMISNIVYDCPQFRKKIDLVKKIEEVILKINTDNRKDIIDLYGQIRSRLAKVLCNNGNLYNW